MNTGKKSLFLLLTLFSAITVIISCKAKETNGGHVLHDTIFIEKRIEANAKEDRILKGTTLLRASKKNMDSRWLYGINLQEIGVSECLESMSETPRNTEINLIKQPNDTCLVISALVDENCSYDFLGEVEIVSGNTINLIYHGYGNYASCNCCFELSYKINLVKDKNYDFSKLKFVTINGHAKKPLPSIR